MYTLLLYDLRRLADQWIAAGSLREDQDPAPKAKAVMADLPLANLSALRVLVSNCYCMCKTSMLLYLYGSCCHGPTLFYSVLNQLPFFFLFMNDVLVIFM